MKMIKQAMLMLGLLLLVGSVSASALRLENGRVLINKGTSVGVLLEHAGEPAYRTSRRVCLDRRSEDYCNSWGTVETWFYTIDGIHWEIRVFGGRVLDLEWSRF